MELKEPCPGCGTELYFDMSEHDGWGEAVECPHCSATIYINGTAPCCFHLGLYRND